MKSSDLRNGTQNMDVREKFLDYMLLSAQKLDSRKEIVELCKVGENKIYATYSRKSYKQWKEDFDEVEKIGVFRYIREAYLSRAALDYIYNELANNTDIMVCIDCYDDVLECAIIYDKLNIDDDVERFMNKQADIWLRTGTFVAIKNGNPTIIEIPLMDEVLPYSEITAIEMGEMLEGKNVSVTSKKGTSTLLSLSISTVSVDMSKGKDGVINIETPFSEPIAIDCDELVKDILTDGRTFFINFNGDMPGFEIRIENVASNFADRLKTIINAEVDATKTGNKIEM